MVLLLLLMPIVDVPLQVRFRPEAFAAARIMTLVVLGMVPLVMPGEMSVWLMPLRQGSKHT